ncbi:MAG: hypothetical protein MJY88_07955 [Bacteroidales bacterium]|nr:hypothetical protein [Bacteroidales bacterium]
MASFGWFGEQEHKVFNYKPIYFDQEEEERRRRFGRVDGTMNKKDADGNDAPGSSIQGAFRNGNYAKRRGGTKAQSIIGLIGLILACIVLFQMAKFYTLL